jgi:hypothetical protein
VSNDDKDVQIARLILRGENLLKELNSTVDKMKSILNVAAIEVQEEKDESRSGADD